MATRGDFISTTPLWGRTKVSEMKKPVPRIVEILNSAQQVLQLLMLHSAGTTLTDGHEGLSPVLYQSEMVGAEWFAFCSAGVPRKVNTGI